MRAFRTLYIAVVSSIVLVSPDHSSAQVAQPGEPVEYQPFFPEKWKQNNHSTRMTPWEGERIVLLTTRADFDGKVMAQFLSRLDGGWKVYADLVGQSPVPQRQVAGKPTIAAVPDPSFIDAMGRGMVGATGIEVAGFYAVDFQLVTRQPDAFPHYYFYEMGRNYFIFGDRHSAFTTGYAVFMRYVCMDALKCKDPEKPTREAIEKAEGKLRETNLSFLKAFTTVAGLGEKENRLKDVSPSDQPVMYASAMLRLRRDCGGDEWVKRFFKFLAQCPPVRADSEDGAMAQALNWMIAASCAARRDLSGVFVTRWRLPLGQKARAALASVDWRRDDLSPLKLIGMLPGDEMPQAFAVKLPGFLTPQRRATNLLADPSFEQDGSAWAARSWRGNTKAARLVDAVGKDGKQVLEIHASEDDDITYRQLVTVKPNASYLLSGWIKTKDVEIVQKGGQTGANLYVLAGDRPVASPSVIGSQEWTYTVLLFNSGEKTDVEVGARLGFHYSTTKGTAWFDDLALIELDSRRPANAPK